MNPDRKQGSKKECPHTSEPCYTLKVGMLMSQLILLTQCISYHSDDCVYLFNRAVRLISDDI